MKTFVINFQDVNWDDDGGDHDPFVIQMEDEDMIARLHSTEFIPGNINTSEPDDMKRKNADLKIAIDNAIIVNPEYPLTVDGVFVIWTI